MGGRCGGWRFGIPTLRTGVPTNRKGRAASRPPAHFSGFPLLAAIALGTGAAPADSAKSAVGEIGPPQPAEDERVESLRRAFAADRDSGEARARLRELARRAPPTPELVDAVAAAAGELGPEGWTAAGVLLRRALRPLDALAAFDRAVRSPAPPAGSEPDIEAGRMLAELQCHEQALARFERHPRNADAIRSRAVVLARLGRAEEALALVEELLLRDEAGLAAVLVYAELLDSVGRGEEAVGPLRRLAGTADAGGRADSLLGRILLNAGRSAEAVPHLEAAVDAAPDDAQARFALGRARLALGETETAEALLRRTLADDPTRNAARLELVQVLRRRGRHEEAERLFAEFERRKAESDRSSQLLGEAEFRPEDFRAVSAFVVHALRIGDHGLALRGAQRFLIEFPEEADRHVLLARVWREVGSARDAERVLRRALDRFAGDAGAERRLGAALAALERGR